MRLYEIANAQEQLALWKLISDSVWNSISVQAQAQEKKRAKDAKAAKTRLLFCRNAHGVFIDYHTSSSLVDFVAKFNSTNIMI